jgi:phosphoglycerate dehydrogenase-like enzyme
VKYLTTLDLDDEWLAALSKSCPGLEILRQVATDPSEISDTVWAGVDILHTSNVFPLPAQAPRLRWIQLDTSGVEHVTGHPIWESNVEITTLGGIAPIPMAEFTVMSLLALAHHQPVLEELRHNRTWPASPDRLTTLTPLQVDGATATIIGHGRIGRELARLLNALGMRVIGISRRGQERSADAALHYDRGRSLVDPAPVEHRPISQLHDVLPRSDFLIVIAPLTAATTGLIGAEALASLKTGACIVNVSRGAVVDESALLAALRSRHVRYAAVDVFEDEPLSPDSVWWTEPNALVTPHVAGLAPRYKEQVLELLCTNIARYSARAPLLNRADRAAGY